MLAYANRHLVWSSAFRLITAYGARSNGSRCRLWKVRLRQLADRHETAIKASDAEMASLKLTRHRDVQDAHPPLYSHQFLDDAVGQAALEVFRQFHPHAIDDGLPDIGYRHVGLHEVALMFEAQRLAAAEDEGEHF